MEKSPDSSSKKGSSSHQQRDRQPVTSAANGTAATTTTATTNSNNGTTAGGGAPPLAAAAAAPPLKSGSTTAHLFNEIRHILSSMTSTGGGSGSSAGTAGSSSLSVAATAAARGENIGTGASGSSSFSKKHRLGGAAAVVFGGGGSGGGATDTASSVATGPAARLAPRGISTTADGAMVGMLSGDAPVNYNNDDEDDDDHFGDKNKSTSTAMITETVRDPTKKNAQDTTGTATTASTSSTTTRDTFLAEVNRMAMQILAKKKKQKTNNNTTTTPPNATSPHQRDGAGSSGKKQQDHRHKNSGAKGNHNNANNNNSKDNTNKALFPMGGAGSGIMGQANSTSDSVSSSRATPVTASDHVMVGAQFQQQQPTAAGFRTVLPPFAAPNGGGVVPSASSPAAAARIDLFSLQQQQQQQQPVQGGAIKTMTGFPAVVSAASSSSLLQPAETQNSSSTTSNPSFFSASAGGGGADGSGGARFALRKGAGKGKGASGPLHAGSGGAFDDDEASFDDNPQHESTTDSHESTTADFSSSSLPLSRHADPTAIQQRSPESPAAISAPSTALDGPLRGNARFGSLEGEEEPSLAAAATDGGRGGSAPTKGSLGKSNNKKHSNTNPHHQDQHQSSGGSAKATSASGATKILNGIPTNSNNSISHTNTIHTAAAAAAQYSRTSFEFEDDELVGGYSSNRQNPTDTNVTSASFDRSSSSSSSSSTGSSSSARKGDDDLLRKDHATSGRKSGKRAAAPPLATASSNKNSSGGKNASFSKNSSAANSNLQQQQQRSGEVSRNLKDIFKKNSGAAIGVLKKPVEEGGTSPSTTSPTVPSHPTSQSPSLGVPMDDDSEEGASLASTTQPGGNAAAGGGGGAQSSALLAAAIAAAAEASREDAWTLPTSRPSLTGAEEEQQQSLAAKEDVGNNKTTSKTADDDDYYDLVHPTSRGGCEHDRGDVNGSGYLEEDEGEHLEEAFDDDEEDEEEEFIVDARDDMYDHREKYHRATGGAAIGAGGNGGGGDDAAYYRHAYQQTSSDGVLTSVLFRSVDPDFFDFFSNIGKWYADPDPSHVGRCDATIAKAQSQYQSAEVELFTLQQEYVQLESQLTAVTTATARQQPHQKGKKSTVETASSKINSKALKQRIHSVRAAVRDISHRLRLLLQVVTLLTTPEAVSLLIHNTIHHVTSYVTAQEQRAAAAAAKRQQQQKQKVEDTEDTAPEERNVVEVDDDGSVSNADDYDDDDEYDEDGAADTAGAANHEDGVDSAMDPLHFVRRLNIVQLYKKYARYYHMQTAITAALHKRTDVGGADEKKNEQIDANGNDKMRQLQMQLQGRAQTVSRKLLLLEEAIKEFVFLFSVAETADERALLPSFPLGGGVGFAQHRSLCDVYRLLAGRHLEARQQQQLEEQQQQQHLTSSIGAGGGGFLGGSAVLGRSSAGGGSGSIFQEHLLLLNSPMTTIPATSGAAAAGGGVRDNNHHSRTNSASGRGADQIPAVSLSLDAHALQQQLFSTSGSLGGGRSPCHSPAHALASSTRSSVGNGGGSGYVSGRLSGGGAARNGLAQDLGDVSPAASVHDSSAAATPTTPAVPTHQPSQATSSSAAANNVQAQATGAGGNAAVAKEVTHVVDAVSRALFGTGVALLSTATHHHHHHHGHPIDAVASQNSKDEEEEGKSTAAPSSASARPVVASLSYADAARHALLEKSEQNEESLVATGTMAAAPLSKAVLPVPGPLRTIQALYFDTFGGMFSAHTHHSRDYSLQGHHHGHHSPHVTAFNSLLARWFAHRRSHGYFTPFESSMLQRQLQQQQQAQEQEQHQDRHIATATPTLFGNGGSGGAAAAAASAPPPQPQLPFLPLRHFFAGRSHTKEGGPLQQQQEQAEQVHEQSLKSHLAACFCAQTASYATTTQQQHSHNEDEEQEGDDDNKARSGPTPPPAEDIVNRMTTLLVTLLTASCTGGGENAAAVTTVSVIASQRQPLQQQQSFPTVATVKPTATSTITDDDLYFLTEFVQSILRTSHHLPWQRLCEMLDVVQGSTTSTRTSNGHYSHSPSASIGMQSLSLIPLLLDVILTPPVLLPMCISAPKRIIFDAATQKVLRKRRFELAFKKFQRWQAQQQRQITTIMGKKQADLNTSTQQTEGGTTNNPSLNVSNITATDGRVHNTSTLSAACGEKGVKSATVTAGPADNATATAAAALSTFALRVVMDPFKTGFEEVRELSIAPGTVIAGRYQIIDLLGQATFSRAVRCIDLQQRYRYDDETGEYAVQPLDVPDDPLIHVDGTPEPECKYHHNDEQLSSEAKITEDNNEVSQKLNKSNKTSRGKGRRLDAHGDDDDEDHDHLFGSISSFEDDEDNDDTLSEGGQESDSDTVDHCIKKNNNKKKSSPIGRADLSKDIASSTAAEEDAPGERKTRSAETYVHVCLKIINNTKEFFDQSLDEVRLLHLLNAKGDPDTQHFVRMFDFFYFKEHTCIVTELLSDNLYEYGKYIRDHCCDDYGHYKAYFTVRRLRMIAKQLLSALQFVHSLNLIHCDLKPENILFVSHRRCVIKVIDFGSSCFTSDHLSSYVQSRSYRAPEVILGADYDGRVDIWSVGAILVELATQQVLFEAETAAEMLARIVSVCGTPLPHSLLYEGRCTHNFIDRFGCIYEYGAKNDDDGGAGHDHDHHHSEDCYYLYTPEFSTERFLTSGTSSTTAVVENTGEDGDHSSHPHPSGIQQVEPYARLRSKLAAIGIDPLSQFVDFVTQCLDLDHKRRPTSAALLHHPFLQELDEEEDEDDAAEHHAGDDDRRHRSRHADAHEIDSEMMRNHSYDDEGEYEAGGGHYDDYMHAAPPEGEADDDNEGDHAYYEDGEGEAEEVQEEEEEEEGAADEEEHEEDEDEDDDHIVHHAPKHHHHEGSANRGGANQSNINDRRPTVQSATTSAEDDTTVYSQFHEDDDEDEEYF